MTKSEEKQRTMKTFDEYEIMVERLRRIDKKEYDSENEHRFILEIIKACFKEVIHQRDYIKQLESKLMEYEKLMGTPIQELMKDVEMVNILKNLIKVIPNFKDTSGSKYFLIIRPDVVVADEVKEYIKEWLDE